VGLGERPGAKREFGEADELLVSASDHRVAVRSAPSAWQRER
jgi:hypothetical protein